MSGRWFICSYKSLRWAECSCATVRSLNALHRLDASPRPSNLRSALAHRERNWSKGRIAKRPRFAARMEFPS